MTELRDAGILENGWWSKLKKVASTAFDVVKTVGPIVASFIEEENCPHNPEAEQLAQIDAAMGWENGWWTKLKKAVSKTVDVVKKVAPVVKDAIKIFSGEENATPLKRLCYWTRSIYRCRTY